MGQQTMIGRVNAFGVISGERQVIPLLTGSADRSSVLSAEHKYNSNVHTATARGSSKAESVIHVGEQEWVISLVKVCQAVLRDTPLDEWPESLDQLEDEIAGLEERKVI